MELSTLLGTAVAVASVLFAMIFKHVGFDMLLNPAAIFVIFGGTIGCTLNAIPTKDIKSVGKLFGKVFTSQKFDNIGTIKNVIELSQMARKDGLLSLEANLEKISDPFLKTGIELLLSGQAPEAIEETLASEIEAMEERHQKGALIFSQAGSYAPTMGVLGAVLGLISALGSLNDTEVMGAAIAAAFIATVFGIFTGYALWNPFATKLKQKSKDEIISKNILMKGVLLLGEGLSPNLIQERLLSYLPPADKAKYLQDMGGGKGRED